MPCSEDNLQGGGRIRERLSFAGEATATVDVCLLPRPECLLRTGCDLCFLGVSTMTPGLWRYLFFLFAAWSGERIGQCHTNVPALVYSMIELHQGGRILWTLALLALERLRMTPREGRVLL